MEKNKQAFPEKQLALSLLLPLVIGFFAISSQGKSPGAVAAPKSQFNSQVFEKTDNQQGFKSQVKLVREMDGETQVFFTDRPGFFRLEENSPLRNILIKAQKMKRPAEVVVDMDSRSLLQVKDLE